MGTLNSLSMPKLGLCAAVLAAAIGVAGCNDNSTPTCSGAACVPPPPLALNFGVAVADFNGDGKPDVASLSWFSHGTPGNVSLFLHDAATNTFLAPQLTADGMAPSWMKVADINGDGFPDLVTASNDGGFISVLINSGDGHGTFGAPAFLASQGATGIAVGDLNGDGVPDIVVADYPVSMFLQSASARGTFAAPVGLYTGGAATVELGDLNGDGLLDVVLVDAVGVKVLFHGADPTQATFGTPVSVFTQTANAYIQGGNLIAVGDVDGDGLADLVVADPGPSDGSAPTLNVLRNDPTHPGTFLAAMTYPLPANANEYAIKIADLNGDGLPDLVVGGDGVLTVFLQQAGGTFAAGVNYPLTNGDDAFQVEVLDVNGDGLPDLIVTAGPTGTLVNGVTVKRPGVLLQDAAHPGAFLPLTDLP